MQKNIEYKSASIEAFYRTHRIRWKQLYESERVVFERLDIGAGSSVLDIGCGCGGLGLALKERFGVGSYTGVEINRQAAETARSTYPGAKFLCADILALSPDELQEHSFDVVVSLGCIDWNVQFEEMLSRSYQFVKPGGHFVSSFRLTPGESQTDFRRSYQHINFEGKREGEIAPYVVLNTGVLLRYLTALSPAYIYGFGYWGKPSPTAVTPLETVGFAVIAVQKPLAVTAAPVVEFDLPDEFRSIASQFSTIARD